MISINRHTLPNGLRVIHSFDGNTSMVAVNMLYNVGARDENPERTGMAHLFEHLMFGGSANVPDFDTPLQLAGAENNAWTNNDITNYYISIPASNIETAFWLESDRMLSLNLTQKVLDTQKSVVIEEFKQRNLNQPYGDLPLILRPLAYKVHPYQWATIGKEISQIEAVTLDEAKKFFQTYYTPSNAILSVVGNIDFEQVVALAEKWFAPIPNRLKPQRNLPQEPVQTEERRLTVKRNVPAPVLCKVFHMVERTHPDYVACDLISDIFANGNSARLYTSLVQEKKIFSDINAYISGDVEAGLFHFKGKPAESVSLEEAETALDKEIEKLVIKGVSDYELEKVKNKFESNQLFSEINYLNKATNIAYFELIGKAEDINFEVEKYRAVSSDDVLRVASQLFVKENSSVLYYDIK